MKNKQIKRFEPSGRKKVCLALNCNTPVPEHRLTNADFDCCSILCQKKWVAEATWDWWV